MCPTGLHANQDGSPLTVVNLCLDFKLKAERLVEPFTAFLEENRAALELEDAEDIVSAYLERICPDGLPGSVIMSRASFDQFDRWIIRPTVDGPLASTFAANGLVPTFGGYRRQGAIVIDSFNVTNHISPRAFESRVSGTIHINPETPVMTQSDFDILSQMPNPRQETRQRLDHFRESLQWRKELVFIGQIGIRYDGYEITEDGTITFAVHGNGEIARVARSRGIVMMAASARYSLSRTRWTPIPRIKPQMVKLGQVTKAWRVDAVNQPREQAHPGNGKTEASAGFVTIRRDTNGDSEDAAPDIPEQGFLLSAVGGDMKPINSERFAIDRFLSGKGHNWYLADYLFDIRNAAVPQVIPDAFSQNPPFAPLNDRQRTAVNKSLAASDIVLIQGPPGTGKTTVIVEICYQAARRGYRVLVVSQANSAVDNVLSRLSKDPAIRPLRIGKSTRVDPEGQSFLPGNAPHRWLQAVGRTCRIRMQAAEETAGRIDAADEAFPKVESAVERYEEASGHIERLTERMSHLQSQRNGLYSQQQDLSDSADRCTRMAAALSELSQGAGQTIFSPTSSDLLSDTRLQTIAESAVSQLAKTLSPYRWDIPWLNLSAPNASPFSVLSSAQQAIIPAESLAPSIAEAISFCSNVAEDGPSAECAEIAALQAQRAALLTSSDDDDLLKVAEINRRIKQLCDDNWGRLCRNIHDQAQTIFHNHFPTELDEVVSSLGPDSAFVRTLDELSRLCTALTRKCRSTLDASLGQIAEQAKAEGANMEAKAQQLRQERANVESQIQTVRHDIDKIENQMETYQAQLSECRSRWSELWPSLCPDLKPPGAPPALSSDCLKHRQEQFNHWRGARADVHRRSDKWRAIQQEWSERLKDPQTAEDKTLQSLYRTHANVVGLTCLEAGQRSFHEDDDFRPFDVVIVDEVSKATPTELLMPMMLGRKVILVGDQRQLPPMFKERESSFTEALEEGLIQAEDFKRFRNLITAEFFGELFGNADESLRESLFDHYRSHEQIVGTFNPFYDGKLVIAGEAEGLNRQRQHHLAIRDRNGGWFLEPHHHVLWIDSSRRANGKVFTERQSGSSKVNLLEVELIIASLMRLNYGLKGRGYGPLRTAEAKSRQDGHPLKGWVKQLLLQAKEETIADLFARQQVTVNGRTAPMDYVVKKGDRLSVDARMPIGIITFYGAQLGQIRKKIAEIKAKDPCYLDACSIQSNTVDKFQGREMPIVIVSLVRAPEHRHVGQFVKEYRRINVAFSRAQNLLIIVGAERTFRDVPVEIPSMEDGSIRQVYVYRQIFDLVTHYGGRRYARDLLKW